MSLEYKVLWIDDHKDEFKKEVDALRDFINSLFFIPVIDFCEDISSAKKFIDTKKYDVIFSDFNIDEESGKDFIDYIRGKSVNTEVLFYSGQSQLPEGKLERVSFFFGIGSGWSEKLLKKMENLISLTVDKLNDLSQLRGLVVTEVSELDVMMKTIVSTYCMLSDDNEKHLRDYIVDKIEKRTKKILKTIDCNSNCFHEWKDRFIPDIIFEQGFDSYNTARALLYIIKEKKYANSNFLDNYKNEIIQNRNILAHCQAKMEEDGNEVLITSREDKRYTPDDINLIRKNIIKYHKMFEAILFELKNEKALKF